MLYVFLERQGLWWTTTIGGASKILIDLGIIVNLKITKRLSHVLKMYFKKKFEYK